MSEKKCNEILSDILELSTEDKAKIFDIAIESLREFAKEIDDLGMNNNIKEEFVKDLGAFRTQMYVSQCAEDLWRELNDLEKCWHY